MTYKTFIRSGNSFEELAKARKRTIDTGLTYDEAYDRCHKFNYNRTRM